MGTSARMGPGYFPFWLGVCLAVLGAVVSLGAMLAKSSRKNRAGEIRLENPVIVIGSVALCGVVLNILGVYISVFLLVFLSSMASHVFSWKVAAINGSVSRAVRLASVYQGFRFDLPLVAQLSKQLKESRNGII